MLRYPPHTAGVLEQVRASCVTGGISPRDPQVISPGSRTLVGHAPRYTADGNPRLNGLIQALKGSGPPANPRRPARRANPRR